MNCVEHWGSCNFLSHLLKSCKGMAHGGQPRINNLRQGQILVRDFKTQVACMLQKCRNAGSRNERHAPLTKKMRLYSLLEVMPWARFVLMKCKYEIVIVTCWIRLHWLFSYLILITKWQEFFHHKIKIIDTHHHQESWIRGTTQSSWRKMWWSMNLSQKNLRSTPTRAFRFLPSPLSRLGLFCSP